MSKIITKEEINRLFVSYLNTDSDWQDISDHINELHHQALTEVLEWVNGRIVQMELQLSDPEVQDKYRIGCKLDAYREFQSKLQDNDR